ncbi:unnamed protein product [Effrenium voratum]|uniref:Uncharacterized protein n=1 Tax=Effrenium voratum TaxID=2562239 RepID=A0AA36HVU2_9DINO|nr:unnamed protein product [Effrenium voratum]CAJ1443234.1 unnamed protein product [Effrenium voratum]
MGMEDWDESAVDLLLGVACVEADELLATATRLSKSSGSAVTVEDMRIAADWRYGHRDGADEQARRQAAKRRKKINEKPLPEVKSKGQPLFPQDVWIGGEDRQQVVDESAEEAELEAVG